MANTTTIEALVPLTIGVNAVLQIHGWDFPGMKLISFQINGNNYLDWRRSMHIALGTKDKLELVDGGYHVPAKESSTYHN